MRARGVGRLLHDEYIPVDPQPPPRYCITRWLRVLPIINMSLSQEAILYQQAHINDNIQPNIYAACAVCMPAAFVAVGLRLWARHMTAGGYGKEDVAILLALLFTSAFVALCIWGMISH
jgi:hypothetical protein